MRGGFSQVVCVDLWGTLIRHEGDAHYTDTLERRSGLRVTPSHLCKVMSRPMGDYREMVEALVGDLLRHGDSVNDLSRLVNFSHQDIQEAADLWQKENQQAVWIPGAQESLRALKREGAFLVLFTDSTSLGWEDVDKNLGVSSFFHRRYVSAYQGFWKQDLIAWRVIEAWMSRLRPRKDEYWVIDDRECLRERADEMGWRFTLVREKGIGEIYQS